MNRIEVRDFMYQIRQAVDVLQAQINLKADAEVIHTTTMHIAKILGRVDGAYTAAEIKESS